MVKVFLLFAIIYNTKFAIHKYFLIINFVDFWEF